MNRSAALASAAAAAAMLAVSVLVTPAGAAAKRGSFAGCTWDYKPVSRGAEMEIGITDAANDGHGCTLAAMDSKGFAAAVYVKDGSDNRMTMHIGLVKGCATLVVYAAAVPAFGPPMKKSQVGRFCA